MTTTQALKLVKKNWATLPHQTIEGHEGVWFVDHDISRSYEVDYEKIGMKGDGTLVWAYASGCSCWGGDYETKPIPDIKVFEFNHTGMSEEWQKQLLTFVEKYKL